MAVAFWDRSEDGYEGPVYSDEPYDVVYLGGTAPSNRVPGTSEVTCVSGVHVDVQRSPGFNGGTIIQDGYIAAKVTIATTLWTPAQWTAYQELLALIWQPKKSKLAAQGGTSSTVSPGATPEQQKAAAVAEQRRRNQEAAQAVEAAAQSALQIQHPKTDVYRVTAVVITSVSGPDPGSQPGSMVMNISAVEYVPAERTKQTKSKAGSRTKGAPAKRAADAFDLETGRPANKPAKPSAGEGGPGGAG